MKKFAMYGLGLYSLICLSQFLLQGYELWDLSKAAVFGTQSLLIYLKKW